MNDQDGASSRRSYLFAKILQDCAQQISLEGGFPDTRLVIGGPSSLPGALLESDLRRFMTKQPQSAESVQRRLVDALDGVIVSIAEFFYSDAEKGTKLGDDVQARYEEISVLRSEMHAKERRIQELVGEIDEIHPRLHGQLVRALETCPPLIQSFRTASTELLATTIETSLLKLSLIHERMHQTLYNHTAPRTHTMSTALSNARAALSEAQRRLDEEEAELDRQLEEYEEVLRLADGGYAQVVEDMAEVRKGTEECRHDLRRLGWSGG